MEIDRVGELGQDAFLLLLTTQLKYQDPLDPVDNSEFIGQLAQFSQLEETIALGSTMESATQYMASLNNYGAAGLIGKDVKVEGQAIQISGGIVPQMIYSLAEESSEVNVQIYDLEGNLVRVLNDGSQSPGSHSVAWDGLDSDGLAVPDGNYLYQVTAFNGSGAPTDVMTFVTGRITGVRYEAGIAYLMVNGEEIPAAGIVEIYN